MLNYMVLALWSTVAAAARGVKQARSPKRVNAAEASGLAAEFHALGG